MNQLEQAIINAMSHHINIQHIHEIMTLASKITDKLHKCRFNKYMAKLLEGEYDISLCFNIDDRFDEAIISHDSSYLRLITNPSKKIIRKAIRHNEYSARYVRIDLDIFDMLSNIRVKYMVKNVSNEVIMKHCVKYSQFNIDHLDNNMKLDILRHNGNYIRRVTRPTDEMYLTSVDEYPNCLDVIPTRLHTQEMYDRAVSKDSQLNSSKHRCILKVPIESRTVDMWITSLKDDMHLIKQLLIDVVDQSIQYEIIRHILPIHPSIMTYLRAMTLPEELQLIAVENDTIAKTEDHINMYAEFVLSGRCDDPSCKTIYCPKEMLMRYELAIKSSPFAIRFIDEPSYTVCKAAVKTNRYALLLIPKDRHTKELIELARSQPHHTFKFGRHCATPKRLVILTDEYSGIDNNGHASTVYNKNIT